MAYTEQELQRVFALQQKQQWINKSTTAEQRIAVLQKLKAAIQARESDVQDALSADLGKTEMGVKSELNAVYTEIDDATANLAEWMKPVDIEPSPAFAGSRARITYEARGIVLLFGPWNFPFNLVFQPLTQIISAGNCAMVKPNEMAANTSKVSAEIIREVFDESDVAVFEGGVELANQLLELPVNHIFFTGSPAVGKIVMGAAAKHLASVTLELGGKNPVIVDRSANLQDAAAKLAVMRNVNSGQVCLCPENIWVPEEKEQEFLAIVQATFQAMFFVDGKFNPAAVGKLIDERNFERVTGYIEDAKSKGATVVCGGESDSTTRSIHPTILKDVPADAKIMGEETFGPILNVFTYKEMDEAISVIQGQPKPLALYIFAQDDDVVEDIMQRTSSGGVTVNNCIMHCAEHRLPFGGVNTSGIGRYHSVHGFKELSHERALLMMEPG